VAGNDDVNATEGAEVGRPPSQSQAVVGGQRMHDRKAHERSSTRPGRVRENQRNDYKDRRWGARALATWQDDAG